MEQRNQFTEEMLRQMYQRRGYQVIQLCGEAVNDRQKVMDMTFRAFGEAHRRLGELPEDISAEEQDNLLLECTRKVICSALNIPDQTTSAPIPEEVPVPASPEEDYLPNCADMDNLAASDMEVPAPEDQFFLPEGPDAVEEGPSMIDKFNTMQTEAPLENEPLELTDTSGSSVGWALLVFVLILVILGLLWAIWGVAQNLFGLPQLDLGYHWFNTNVYPLF